MTGKSEINISGKTLSSILADLKNGSYDAYEFLYRHYVASIQRFLFKLLRSEEEAKEITQKIFIRLWEKRESIDPDSDIKIFLFQTARFYAYNYFDHKKVKEKYLDQLNTDFDHSLSTEELIQYEETSLLIELALEKMPEQRRKVFEMSRKGGKSNDTIADELQLSKRTVEKHISMAISDIKSMLKENQ